MIFVTGIVGGSNNGTTVYGVFCIRAGIRTGMSSPYSAFIDLWNVIDWNCVEDRKDFIIARMKQLDERHVPHDCAAQNLHRSRIQNKAYFDANKKFVLLIMS